MLAAAASVGWLARDRYVLTTAPVAAAVAAMVGVLGQWVKGTFDGCLGPLNTLTTTCSLRPRALLPLAMYPAGYLLGPMVLLACLVAALAGVLRRLAAPQSPAGLGTLTSRDGTLATLTAIAVVVACAITFFQTMQLGAPEPQADRLREYDVSPTYSWANDGDPIVDTLFFTSALAKHYAADLETLRTSIPLGCQRFEALAAQARRYAPAPVALVQDTWANLQSALDQTSAACQAVASARNRAGAAAGLKILDSAGYGALAAEQRIANWGADLCHKTTQPPSRYAWFCQ